MSDRKRRGSEIDCIFVRHMLSDFGDSFFVLKGVKYSTFKRVQLGNEYNSLPLNHFPQLRGFATYLLLLKPECSNAHITVWWEK